MSKKYNYEELQQRPDWNDWLRIKNYIPNLPEKNDLTVAPEYGYILDKLRQKYNIYISVIPIVDSELDTEKTLTFRFNGKIMYLDKINNVLEEIIVSGRKYTDTMRLAINKSIDILEDQAIIIKQIEDSKDPSIPYLEVSPKELRIWSIGSVSVKSNTDWNINNEK